MGCACNTQPPMFEEQGVDYDEAHSHMEHMLVRLRLAFCLEEHHLKLLFSQPIDWMEDAP